LALLMTISFWTLSCCRTDPYARNIRMHSDEVLQDPDNVDWKHGDEVPTLGNMPFLGIAADGDSSVFGNPKFAVSCQIR